jgi:hypothetical protein
MWRDASLARSCSRCCRIERALFPQELLKEREWLFLVGLDLGRGPDAGPAQIKQTRADLEPPELAVRVAPRAIAVGGERL